jgi:hypothetical protein
LAAAAARLLDRSRRGADGAGTAHRRGRAAMRLARLGLWQRLMLLIGGTVALMWLALALTSVTFARFQTQFSGLAASQVPRIALTANWRAIRRSWPG